MVVVSHPVTGGRIENPQCDTEEYWDVDYTDTHYEWQSVCVSLQEVSVVPFYYVPLFSPRVTFEFLYSLGSLRSLWPPAGFKYLK